MTKEKRKLYHISEMRQAGLNYIQRGLEIQKIKMSLCPPEIKNKVIVPDDIKPSEIIPQKSQKLTWYQRFILWLKRIGSFSFFTQMTKKQTKEKIKGEKIKRIYEKRKI